MPKDPHSDRRTNTATPPTDDRDREPAQRDLIRELETAQITLEAQNEELSRAVRELEASRQELFDLYEEAPVGYLSLNAKGVIQRSNAMARRLFGAEDRPIVGYGFSRFLDPRDWDVWFRQWRTLSAEPAEEEFDLRLRGDADPPVIVQVSAHSRFDRQGRLEGLRLAIRDVSIQRHLEQKFKRVYGELEMVTRAARLGTWILDPDSGTSEWNEQLYRLLGLTPGDGREDGERFFTFIHPDDREGVLKSRKALVNSDADAIEEEFRIVQPGGEVRWLGSRGRIYRDGNGRATWIGGINYDITDRKRLEAQRKRAQRQLVRQLAATNRLNDELTQYAYAVSHDLKEPLRAIRNYTDFLAEDLAGRLDEQQREYLEGLRTAVTQGDTLINDLRTLSRLDQVTPEPQPVDLAQFIEELTSVLPTGDGLRVRSAADWPVIHADRVLLRQVLQNLIGNAAKFNRNSPRRITLGWRPEADGGIEIHVRDNGIGIAEQHQEKIFKIFQRLHTQGEFEGTGMGLAIVRKAVYLLGGTLELTSEPGHGSTFYVRLPDAKATKGGELP